MPISEPIHSLMLDWNRIWEIFVLVGSLNLSKIYGSKGFSSCFYVASNVTDTIAHHSSHGFNGANQADRIKLNLEVSLLRESKFVFDILC